VATAAVIGGFAVVNQENPSAETPPVTNSPSGIPTVPPTDDGSPTPDPSDGTQTPGGDTFTVGVYYVGDTPFGPRLYREFHQAVGATALDAALVDATSAQPLDPDYRTDWPEGIIASTAFDGLGSDGLIQVTLADASVHDRPAGMSKAEAQIAVEALIYTAQGAMQARAPVQFLLDGNPVDQVYGVPTSEPLAQGTWSDVLALVNLTTPEEGATVSGSLDVEGVASSFEATVPWQILQGSQVVDSGSFMADGWMEHLYPFSGAIDVSGLAPGTYTFVARTDDASGGAEGPGAYEDTRTIVIE
jgi:hypothetical protein